MLEDINVHVEMLRRRGTLHCEQQIPLYKDLLVKIFSQLNEFFGETAVELGPSLMSCYCDSIFYFVSRANTQEVAEVSCESLTTLLQRIGPNMKRSFWADFTV